MKDCNPDHAARKLSDIGPHMAPSGAFVRGILRIAKDYPRTSLILHAGAPKTGTTSLQHFLFANREAHQVEGLYYPLPEPSSPDPKHQWLISNLLGEEEDVLLQNLQECFAPLKRNKGQRLLLSTEGLYNHWWDLTPRGRGLMKALAETFPLSVWVWFRDPVEFAESLYKQGVKNPRNPLVSFTGRDISLSDALDDPWFSQRLDYLGFLEECEALIGDGRTRVFFHDGDTIGAACRALSLKPPAPMEGKRHNTSLSSASIEVLRVINRYPITPGEKKIALARVNELEAILSGYSPKSIVTEEEARRIGRMTSLSTKALKAPW